MNVQAYLYKRCLAAGFTKEAICALFAQIDKESRWLPNNVENGRGWSDETYTEAVDNGSYQNFVHDEIGYGLYQLTFWSRKQSYLKFAKTRKKSIGDVETQIDFLFQEMRENFSGIYHMLKTSHDLYSCTRQLLYVWENPKKKEKNMQERYKLAQDWTTKLDSLGMEGDGSFVATQNIDAKIEQYTHAAEVIANDDSHGYSQVTRWGNPDYDCSSLVCKVVQDAGIPVRDNGASYTGNMRGIFLSCGFQNVTASVNLNSGGGLKRGDILLKDSTAGHANDHVVIYIGNGKIVHARSSDGNTAGGDQNGREICIQGYYNSPWDVVLRYADSNKISSTKKDDILRKGSKGDSVKDFQDKLLKLGYDLGAWGADGDFGEGTLTAVLAFQNDAVKAGYDLGADGADGEVGKLTLAALDKALARKDRLMQKPETTKTDDEAAAEDLQQEKESLAPETAAYSEVAYEPKVGDIVYFNGAKYYLSPTNYTIGIGGKPGYARITSIYQSAIHMYHLIGVGKSAAKVYGWVDRKDFDKANDGY